jgi:hypothetical protein
VLVDMAADRYDHPEALPCAAAVAAAMWDQLDALQDWAALAALVQGGPRHDELPEPQQSTAVKCAAAPRCVCGDSHCAVCCWRVPAGRLAVTRPAAPSCGSTRPSACVRPGLTTARPL